MDHIYQRALEFAKKFIDTNGSYSFSNIYVMQTVDRDGKVTGEYYGHNLMTDYGANAFFVGGYDFPTNLYIGNGSGSYNVSMHTIISPIVTTPATTNTSPATTTVDYVYPMYYDSYTGIITAICRKQICFFDYTVSGIDTDVTITEYGIGSDVNNLWTHSWVYDNLGQQASIVKKLNERLIIHVYFALSYEESLINNAWTNGKHIVITSMERFINKMIPSNVYRYKRNNVIYSNGFSNGTSTFVDNIISKYQTITAFDLYTGTGNDNGYFDGFVNWSTGFNMIERDLLQSNETFDSVQVTQAANFKEDDALTYNFGHADYLPFTTLSVQHAYGYNYLTGAYDTEETFVQSNDKWYCETPMQTSLATPIYFTSNNTIVTMYLYQNIHNTDPITAVKTAASAVYATNKYWDVSTWVLITDHANVPVAVQNAKYWITNSNTLNITPVRGNTPFMIKPLTNQYSSTLYYNVLQNKIGMYYSSFSDGIFAQGGSVYRLSDGNITRFNQLTRLYQNKTYGYGNMIINVSTDAVNTLSYVNMTEQTPTVQTISVDSTKISNMFTAYTTESGTGFVLFQQGTNCFKVDIRTTTISTTMMSDIKNAACVWNTTRYCYISSASGEERVIRVKSLADDTLVQTFTIPSTVAVPTFIYGYQNWVYISDGSTYTYVGNIIQGTLNECTTVLPWTTQHQYLRFSHTDRCMIVYQHNVSDASGVYIMRNDTPTAITTYTEQYGIYYRDACRICSLKNWYNTIILIESWDQYYGNGVINRGSDFGYFLYNGSAANSVSFNEEYQIVPYGTEHYVYGNSIHLLFNLIPHRLVGTFTSISAYNNIKHVSGKQWETNMTNIPTFTGLPPGVQQ